MENSSIEMEDGEIEKVQAGFRQFVRDLIPIVTKIVGVQIALPTVDVVLVPDGYWGRMRDSIPLCQKFDRDDWAHIKAVAAYFPLKFEDKLRALAELQETDPRHNYDAKLDYDAVVFLHLCKRPAKSQEEKAVIELYSALAAACFPLTVNVSLGCFGVSPITNPLNDSNAMGAIHALVADMTPEQFTSRYGPK
jgi:hypothetical protein